MCQLPRLRTAQQALKCIITVLTIMQSVILREPGMLLEHCPVS